jgi:hypothetical protein
MLDTRRQMEQREDAWRSSDDLAWKKLTGGTPQDAGAGGSVASAQDVALREGAAIVADMHDLRGHG